MKLAPDIGTTVNYRNTDCGVIGWLKISTIFKPSTDQVLRHTCVSKIIEELKENPDNRFVWCSRKDATHLSIGSTSSYAIIAPITECKVVGRQKWDTDMIRLLNYRLRKYIGESIL
jgi:hypothetical protein